MAYSTKQKDLILNVLKKYNKQFTIKDIYNEVKDFVGLTTIYRLVDKLVLDGIITKTIDNNITYYQYLEHCEHENHFYLKCEKCKTMIHVDCDCISELSKHIFSEHKFTPSREHIIITGLCEKCRK